MDKPALESLGRYIDLLLDVVCVVSSNGEFAYVSKGSEVVFGYRPDEMIGRQMINFVHPDDRERTLNAARDIMSGQHKVNFQNRYIHKQGHVVYVLWSARWSEADQRRVAVARDITKQYQAEQRQQLLLEISQAAHEARNVTALNQSVQKLMANYPDQSMDTDLESFIARHIDTLQERQALLNRLQNLAHTDVLTQLPNRAAFYTTFQQAVEHAHQKRQALALLYLDLDNFKTVNDLHGHKSGDRVLLQAARIIRQAVRSTDTVARIGGDEFVVLLEYLEHPNDATAVAQKIITAFENQSGDELLDQVRPSIGIAIWPRHGADLDDLLQVADTAMYEAKHHETESFIMASSSPPIHKA
ncbi:PAS domain S-box protein [Pseudidiomarina aestuarii]|uniref:PAS domain S-box protein n=1 Tax=Pseudidiomarina aestuarii TaxID=624146 RepID=A0A7Z6ZSX9_9GAMM|nr:sensor domain-containing diguanylate cyclase [Pseudidiomarina aestuarii]RUO40814.1 PAS domain S-box protein [Pseudidiomarina aestuarii]